MIALGWSKPRISDPEEIKMKEIRKKTREGVSTWGADKRSTLYLLPDTVFPPTLSHGLWKDMDEYDDIFKTLEDYDEITFAPLLRSNIRQIMTLIRRKFDLPCPEKFMFRERADLLCERWSSLAMAPTGRYAKGCCFKGVGDMSALSPILHNIMRERKKRLGGIGGLNEFIMVHASGRATSVTLPDS